jgi:hypothetical protein
MAMKVGSSYKKEWINKSSWQEFCDDIEYSFRIFRKEFLEMSETLLKKPLTLKLIRYLRISTAISLLKLKKL